MGPWSSLFGAEGGAAPFPQLSRDMSNRRHGTACVVLGPPNEIAETLDYSTALNSNVEFFENKKGDSYGLQTLKGLRQVPQIALRR